MLATAAEQRTVMWARRLNRAERRAERAERQLSRSWSEAARRHTELSQLSQDRPVRVRA